MSATKPQLLLEHYLKQLKLPSMLREHEKLAHHGRVFDDQTGVLGAHLVSSFLLPVDSWGVRAQIRARFSKLTSTYTTTIGKTW